MRRIVIATLLASMSTTPALADVPGKDWISRDKIVALMAKRGATVTKMEADDGHWEGEATRKGLRYDFHVNPTTGRVTKWERDTD